MTSPQTQAKITAAALIREVRAAGWARAKLEISPDGSVKIDADMSDLESNDNFLDRDLKMSK